MSKCGHCSGNCGHCSGCAGVLELNEGELAFLRKLGQIPFLPVARKASDMNPVYLEDTDYSMEEYSLILACLEKKGLIDLDYHTPLSGFDDSAYLAYPLRGSMSLTARGQAVLELLETQGIQEEAL